LNPTTDNPTAAPVRLSRWRLGAYATLQLPLAMSALPIVVTVSYFYGKHIFAGIPGILTVLAIIFFVTRLIDAIQDPLIGFISDRLTHFRNGRMMMAIASVPFLGVGFYAIFAPPELGHYAMLLYLFVALLIVHLGYSGVSINYHSLGAELSYDYNERTRVTIWREVFGIVGLLLGAGLPPFLETHFGAADGYHRVAVIFLPLLLIPTCAFWLLSPRPITPPLPKKPFSVFQVFVVPFRNKRFRSLLLVYLINGISVGIAVTVVLFFIEDVLLVIGNFKFAFIGLYFLSGIVSVVFWLWLSRRTSKSAAWAMGIAFSCIGITAAAFVGQGDVVAFGIICVFAGFGLGADYGLPPAILADVIHNEVSESQGESGKYFGLWAMATKLTAAIGGSAALILLDGFNLLIYGHAYDSTLNSGPMALILVYACLPAIVKFSALTLIWRIRIESAKPSVRRQWRLYRRPVVKAKS
jgi:GPH family glycoside/pentoside/hexuronide:cation symporter